MEIAIYVANNKTPNIRSRKPIKFVAETHGEAWEFIQAQGLVVSLQDKLIAFVSINGKFLYPNEIKYYLEKRKKILTRFADKIDEIVLSFESEGFTDTFEDFVEHLIGEAKGGINV